MRTRKGTWEALRRAQEFRPTPVALDRMHGGDCAFASCERGLALAITVQMGASTEPHLWGLCDRHGAELASVFAGRVHWLGVEAWGTEQGVLFDL